MPDELFFVKKKQKISFQVLNTDSEPDDVALVLLRSVSTK